MTNYDQRTRLGSSETQTWSSSGGSSRGASSGGSTDAASDVGHQLLDGYSLQSLGKEACKAAQNCFTQFVDRQKD